MLYVLSCYHYPVGYQQCLSDIWDKSNGICKLPDGAHFALMQGDTLTYYRADMGVEIHFMGMESPQLGPERYHVFIVTGLYSEIPDQHFPLY